MQGSIDRPIRCLLSWNEYLNWGKAPWNLFWSKLVLFLHLWSLVCRFQCIRRSIFLFLCIVKANCREKWARVILLVQGIFRYCSRRQLDQELYRWDFLQKWRRIYQELGSSYRHLLLWIWLFKLDLFHVIELFFWMLQWKQLKNQFR